MFEPLLTEEDLNKAIERFTNVYKVHSVPSRPGVLIIEADVDSDDTRRRLINNLLLRQPPGVKFECLITVNLPKSMSASDWDKMLDEAQSPKPEPEKKGYEPDEINMDAYSDFMRSF